MDRESDNVTRANKVGVMYTIAVYEEQLANRLPVEQDVYKIYFLLYTFSYIYLFNHIYKYYVYLYFIIFFFCPSL